MVCLGMPELRLTGLRTGAWEGEKVSTLLPALGDGLVLQQEVLNL